MNIDNDCFDEKEIKIITTALIKYIVDTDITSKELKELESIIDKFEGSKGQIKH